MTKLCPRGKAAAKRKFKVYPSAYANAYASKICAGKIKDPSGVKRKDFRGPKPAGKKRGGGVNIKTSPSVKDYARVLKDKDRVSKEDLERARKRIQPGKSDPSAVMSRKVAKEKYDKHQESRRELYKSTAGKKIRAFKAGGIINMTKMKYV